MIFILAVILLLPPAPCPGDAAFYFESKTTLFPKEDTTRNQWLSCIYNTVPEQFNPNIKSVCSAFYRGLFPEPGRVGYNASFAQRLFLKNGVIPTLQGQSITACKYAFVLKEFATDY